MLVLLLIRRAKNNPSLNIIFRVTKRGVCRSGQNLRMPTWTVVCGALNSGFYRPYVSNAPTI